MTARNGEGFPKAARIRRRREFLSLGRTGTKRRTEHFVFILGPRTGRGRLGITVSRKIGGAVVRNRLKRRIREVVRRQPIRQVWHSDLIVIAKEGIGAVSVHVLRQELTGVFAGRRASGTSATQS